MVLKHRGKIRLRSSKIDSFFVRKLQAAQGGYVSMNAPKSFNTGCSAPYCSVDEVDLTFQKVSTVKAVMPLMDELSIIGWREELMAEPSGTCVVEASHVMVVNNDFKLKYTHIGKHLFKEL